LFDIVRLEYGAPAFVIAGDASRVKRLGCARRLFSSCYLLLFGGSEAGASWSPFPLLFRYVAGKSTSARLYSASCFLSCYLQETLQWRGLRHVTRRVLGVLPSPLWGGVGGGGRCLRRQSCFTARPPPRRHSASKTRVNALKAPTLPTRGRV